MSAAAQVPAATGERAWRVTWREDFGCEQGGANRSAGGLDLTTWSFDIGTRDMSDPQNPGPENWGNNEPQYYTDRCGLLAAART